METGIHDVCDLLMNVLSLNENQPDGGNPTIVRFLEILPGSRCRVRGPDGLAILILKIPLHLCLTYFEPGTYLEANINRVSVMGEIDGVVTSELETAQIAELLVEGLWPNAFIETEYISEKISELLKRNRFPMSTMMY